MTTLQITTPNQDYEIAAALQLKRLHEAEEAQWAAEAAALRGRFVARQLPSPVRDGIATMKVNRARYGSCIRLEASFRLWFHSRDTDLIAAQLEQKCRYGDRFSIPVGASLSMVSRYVYWIKWRQDGVQCGLRIELMHPQSDTKRYWRLRDTVGFASLRLSGGRATPGRTLTRRIPGNVDVDGGRWR